MPLRRRLAGWSLLVLLAGTPAFAQPFTFEFVNTDLQPLSFGTAAWADVDADGRLDLFLSGSETAASPYVPHAGIYRTIGPTTPGGAVPPRQSFTEEGLGALWHSAAAWHDYDGDGDLDLFATGATNDAEPFAGSARLWRNDGGAFSPVGAGLPAFYSGSVDAADYDHDGDPDLLLTGVTPGGYASEIYRNDGGTFSAVGAGFVGVAFGQAAWGDYDRDGDLDVLLSGVSDDGFTTRIYRNDGGAYVDLGAPLPGLAFSSVAWGDYDADGRLDFMLAGGTLDPRILLGELYIYRNLGGDTFGPVHQESGGYLDGRVAWGDYDNDGLLDALVLGAHSPGGPRFGRVYQHAAGSFRPVLNLAGALYGDAVWGDYDADGDLDVALTGLARGTRTLTNLYRNTQRLVNTPPTAPAGLQATVDAGRVSLSWQAGADEQTPPSGLTYNLRVGTSSGGADVLPPLSEPGTGRRLVPVAGNAGANTAWTLAGLAPGTYYWSVQAVDASYLGSPFAAEGTFSVSAGAVTGVEDDVLPGRSALGANYPNPFAGRTTIRYALPEPAVVTLAVYDVLGRRVRTLAAGPVPAGERVVEWDGRDDAREPMAPGLYLYRLETTDGAAWSRTMTLLR